MVTHYDVTRADIDSALAALRTVIGQQTRTQTAL